MFSIDWSNPPVLELYRSNKFGSTVRHELLFIELHEWRPKSNTCNKLWMVISCISFYHCIFPSVQNEGDSEHPWYSSFTRGIHVYSPSAPPKKNHIQTRSESSLSQANPITLPSASLAEQTAHYFSGLAKTYSPSTKRNLCLSADKTYLKGKYMETWRFKAEIFWCQIGHCCFIG